MEKIIFTEIENPGQKCRSVSHLKFIPDGIVAKIRLAARGSEKHKDSKILTNLRKW